MKRVAIYQRTTYIIFQEYLYIENYNLLELKQHVV
jgi:hypothetical protein